MREGELKGMCSLSHESHYITIVLGGLCGAEVPGCTAVLSSMDWWQCRLALNARCTLALIPVDKPLLISLEQWQRIAVLLLKKDRKEKSIL